MDESLSRKLASPTPRRKQKADLLVRDPNLEFDRVFRLYADKLGRFLAQIVADRWLAEDLIQETYLAAWRGRQGLEDISNVEAWLFAIARNRALQALRRRRRRQRALHRLTGEKNSPHPDPAEAIVVRDFITSHLTPEERILLVLRYVHGFSSGELAEITGRSSDAVRQQLSRVTRALADRIEAESLTSPSIKQQRSESGHQ